MKANVLNKNGEISFYGYCCGYVSRDENKETGNRKELYRGHSVFYVDYLINNIFHSKSFKTLTEAREYFKSIKLN
jgi:hypothetical protein